MLKATLPRLRCPQCVGRLALEYQQILGEEVLVGALNCLPCDVSYPILAGVAILVEDPDSYILEHAKGIAAIVPDSQIPIEVYEEYLEARQDIQVEHIEEDLEAERVTSLYLMNHYLRVGAQKESAEDWWKPATGLGSPVIHSLIKEHWDHGPFVQIKSWVKSEQGAQRVVELGCGVGGLYGELKPKISTYLGIDSSFASVALARHLALGMAYPKKIRIPQDLLQGPVSREIELAVPEFCDGSADFVVGDLDALPVEREAFDLSIALNAIDMLAEPAILPQLSCDLLVHGGVTIQSCPYIWHEQVARELCEILPPEIQSSARAVEWLYTHKARFQIEKSVENLPWLFFKHVRQLEIYSVHLFLARKQ